MKGGSVGSARSSLLGEGIQNQDTEYRKSPTSSQPCDREDFQSIRTTIDNRDDGFEGRAGTISDVDLPEPKTTFTPCEAFGCTETEENQFLPGWARRSVGK